MLQKELNLNETLTEINITNKQHAFLGKYFTVNNNFKNVKYIYIGRVFTCRSGGCTANISTQSNNNNSEFFDYFILYDSACSIKKVRVYDYKATHGHEVTAKSWLKQFEGFAGNTELYVDKNIDAISGATISVYACTADIEHKTLLLKQSVEQQ